MNSGSLFSPLDFAFADASLPDHFNYDFLSVSSNSSDRYSFEDTMSSSSASQIQFLDSIREESSSFDATTSEDIKHALQKIETILMAPDVDELTSNRLHENNERPIVGLEFPGLLQASEEHKTYITEAPRVKRCRETRLQSDSNVKQVLLVCAEALFGNDINEFNSLVEQAQHLVSISGEPIQRLGAYMLEGLVAKHELSGAKIYRSLRCRELKSDDELLSHMRTLYDVCPYMKFGYMAANGAIAEAMRDEDSIHIVDFQIAQGTQWITLLQALASRPGGPPRVRITGIDDPVSEHARGDGLELVGKTLSELSKKFNIPLEFHPLNVYGPQVTREMLDIRPGDALAVNFTFQLHHTPDESVDVRNPRDGLLRLARGLDPKVTTVVEQESNTNTTPFLARFTETLEFYSAMFESIDVTMRRDCKDRVNMEQHCLAKDIVNIIACEGTERVERHELLGKWQSRLSMAGFKPLPLSSYVNSVIRSLMGYYSDCYTLLEKDGALLLGWKNRNLVSASAWQ